MHLAMEQNLFEPDAHYESDGDVSLKHKWSPLSGPARIPESDSGCFDCNICFDSAQDPIVTLCGHLYCWPCIYKWLQVQISSESDQLSGNNCPVCKANISISSLVPLYGRGIPSSEMGSNKPNLDMTVPRRPTPSGPNAALITSTSTSTLPSSDHLRPNFFHPSHYQSFHQYPPYFSHPYTAMASTNLGGTAMTSFYNPTIGMVGELVFARMFGSSNTSLYAYPSQNSNTLVSNGLRMRRQEIQLDKSLNRVSIFLFCCIILCLLLF